MKKACRRTVSAVLTLVCLFSIMFFSCDGGFYASSDDEIIFKTYDAKSWRDTGNLYANRGRSVFRAPSDPSTENYTYKITLSRGKQSFSKSFGGGTVVVMENIPVGPWKITCRAYKSDGSLEYMGSVDAEVVANETTSATVELRKCPVVKFVDVNGNELVNSQTVEFGGKVTKPGTIKGADGLVVVGWSTEAAGNTKFDFNTAINENLTLYAIWGEVSLEDQEGFIRLDLSKYKDKFGNEDMLHIQRRKAGTNDKWETVMYYCANNGYKIDLDVPLPDYYTQPGKKYEYQILQDKSYLGAYTAENGLGEIKITPGTADYDPNQHALVFSNLPTYEPADFPIKEDYAKIQFEIRYKTEDGKTYVYFFLEDMNDDTFYIRKARNITDALGKKIVPVHGWCQTYKKLTDTCTLWWRAEPEYTEADYPAIDVPVDKYDFIHRPETDLPAHVVSDDNYDFIYEVNNNYTKPITVTPFVYDTNLRSTDETESIISVFNEIEIEPNGTREFKFKIADLKTAYSSDEHKNIGFGCYMKPQGADTYNGRCYAIDNCIGKKCIFTVITTENGGFYWTDTQEYLN